MYPIVFVHSLGGSPAQWTPQVDHFAVERPIVTVALPGHGGEPEPEAYSPNMLARAVEQATARLDRFLLVGHSAGALVAIHYTSEHPERVAGLVLVDPGTDMRLFPEEQATQLIGALRSEQYPEVAEGYWNQILEAARDETRERALADLYAASPEALPGFFSTIGRYDAMTPLREIAASHPVLAITTPFSDGEHALHSASPAIKNIRVDGTSHWPHLDKPDLFNATLRAFVEYLES